MAQGKHDLPDWIAPIKGKVNTFVVDPDIYYPRVLAELGVKKPDQYWLEVAFGCMKLDFNLHVGLCGACEPGRSVTRYVRADNGRKRRWNLTMHPPGKTDWRKLSLAERSRHIRENYRRIRGFVPGG